MMLVSPQYAAKWCGASCPWWCGFLLTVAVLGVTNTCPRASAAAVAVGLINMCANLAGYLGNHLFGWMKSRGLGDNGCLLFLAACYLVGGAILAFVKVRASANSSPKSNTNSANSNP